LATGVLLAVVFGPGPVAADTLLVVPFGNSARTAELDWVGESFAESLTVRLAGAGHSLVPREERLAGLERLGLPPAATLTRASWLRLAEEVGADWLVLGEFRVEDATLALRAELIDVRQLTLVRLGEEQGPFDRLLPLQGRLAWQILRQLDPTFPVSLDAFLARFPRLQVSAFESYVRGLLATGREAKLQYFHQAARLEPAYGAPAFRLGELYFDEQDYASAAGWFDKVPAESSVALDAKFFLALCRFYARDYARALETLLPLGERLPVSQVWNNLGVFASYAEQPAAADGYFARALEADPGDADIHFNLGLHRLRGGDADAAARSFAHCLTLAPGDTEALFLRAQALDQLGRSDEASRVRQQAVGDNPALSASLERRQLELDRLQSSFNARLAGAQESPAAASARLKHVAVHVQRGQDLLARGEVEPARREFSEALLLDPDSQPAHFFLAETYRRQGRLAEAISELKASLWSQETVPARLRLAEIYLAQNRMEEAREQVEAALALDPANTEARALEARLGAGPHPPATGRPQ
jgi:tetratricopeptide (TPR) repeat protein